MKSIPLQFLLIVALILTVVYTSRGQSYNSRFTFGVGMRPVKTTPDNFTVFLYDQFGLPDTIRVPVFSFSRYTNMGGYVGFERIRENNLFTQFQVDFDFGIHGNHYVAAVLGMGKLLGNRNKIFSLIPCLNLWVGYMSDKLTTIDAENLHIRSGNDLLDRHKTVTLTKTSMLWGLSPNLILGVKLGDKTNLHITLGYLGTMQTNHKLVFSGKDQDDDSISAKVKVDSGSPVVVGPRDAADRLKSMISVHGFYFTVGLLL